MTHLLCKLFLRGQDPTSPEGRAKYGTLSTIVGIVVNLLLFLGKFLVGFLFHFTAIMADAFNNLSDAGSSVISLVSFRISNRPADRKHPFGQARIEYIASMIISFLILVIGYQLFRDSLVAIITPQELTVDIVTLVVLAVAMGMKLWLFLFYRSIGKKIGSQVLAASAADSLGDVLSTGAVLVAAIIIHITKWYFLDGAVGIIVACLIVWQGIKILLESMHAILGEAPSEELVKEIEAIVATYPEALGIHDMIVHNYGPGHTIASLHVEVDGAMDIFRAHDAIDNIEREIQKKLGIITTVHMDPIVVGDPIVDQLREKMLTLVRSIDARMNIHDFRFVDGITHKNLIFDVTVPFEVKLTDEEVEDEIKARVTALDPIFQCVLTIDRE